MAKGQAITYEQFLAIEKALNEGMKGTDIAQLTGLSENLISQIKTGEHHFCKQKEERPLSFQAYIPWEYPSPFREDQEPRKIPYSFQILHEKQGASLILAYYFYMYHNQYFQLNQF